MALPPEIHLQPRPDGARYELPPRNLGALKIFGLVAIVFGCLFGASSVSTLLKAFAAIARGGIQLDNLIEALFSLPFVIGGCIPIGIGLLILRGRCRIELNRGNVVVRECFGPFFWRRKRELTGLQKLSIAIGGARVNGRAVTQGPLADLSALSAVFDDAEKPWPIAIGYPLPWMRELALDLAQRLQDTGIAATIEESSGKIQVVEENWNVDPGTPPMGEAAAQEPAIPQPAGSLVKLDPHGDGIMLTVPPMGLRKGSKGLFFFAIIWCSFIGFMTTVMVAAAVSSKSKDLWVGLSFLSIFWAIGIGMMLSAINMGRRRAMLLADSRQFKVVRQSPFGVKQWAWPAAEVIDVRLGPSGMAVNNVPVNELQVFTKDGRTGLFSERNDEELLWMAYVIRQALKLPPVRPEQTPPPNGGGWNIEYGPIKGPYSGGLD